MESPIHRAMSIDYGVVIEGKFLLTLDSGETKIMLPGDTSKIYFSFPAFGEVGD
jgi:quercetin dioxygenase-like cupin family protein